MQLFSGDTPLFLAPMAGVTDYAFRTVCAQHGADVTVTEMVSSRALVYQDRKSRGLLRRNEGSLCGAQIFGNDPAMMAEAAQIAVGISGCDFLDINMGCPMPKIANNGDGSALMRDIPLAGRIIRAVADAVSVPVTVKTRLGWDRSCPSAVALARAAEENGAAAITVHGRTKAMLYSGRADWGRHRRASARAVLHPRYRKRRYLRPRAAAALPGAQRRFALHGGTRRLRRPVAVRTAARCPARQDTPGAAAARRPRGHGPAAIRTGARGQRRAYCLPRGAASILHGTCAACRTAGFYKEQISNISAFSDIERLAKEIKRDLR